jgi:hypothetical protein
VKGHTEHWLPAGDPAAVPGAGNAHVWSSPGVSLSVRLKGEGNLWIGIQRGKWRQILRAPLAKPYA